MNRGEKDFVESGRKVRFYFEGRELRGTQGEPIAKALFEAGIRILSYSIKYKRPRSISCASGRCGMCHMEVNGIPGVPTCITPLFEGMQIRRENFRPIYAPLIIQALRAVPLPAGFYYRFFNKPTFVKNMFMKRVRSMAGIGRVTLGPSAQIHPMGESKLKSLSDSYDVIVVGAGISGMAAALAASNNGRSVLLVDEYERPGGHLIGPLEDPELEKKRDELSTAVLGHSAMTLCLKTTAYGFYRPDTVLLGDHSGLKLTRSRHFIFAVGAYDVIPLFENNDIAGIFGERAIRLLLERDHLVPGRKAAIYGSGTGLMRLSVLLKRHGIDVTVIADAFQEEKESPSDLAGIRYIANARLKKAYGRKWLKAVGFAGANGKPIAKTDCDLLCISLPGNPVYELAHQAGFKYELTASPNTDNRVMFPAKNMIKEEGVSFHVVGEASGETDWKGIIAQGESAGQNAATGKNP